MSVYRLVSQNSSIAKWKGYDVGGNLLNSLCGYYLSHRLLQLCHLPVNKTAAKRSATKLAVRLFWSDPQTFLLTAVLFEVWGLSISNHRKGNPQNKRPEVTCCRTSHVVF